MLSVLPDEVISTDVLAPAGDSRQLLNPFDPSQGFVDDEDEPPFDPWESEAYSPGTEVLPDHVDIEALRRRARR